MARTISPCRRFKNLPERPHGGGVALLHIALWGQPAAGRRLAAFGPGLLAAVLWAERSVSELLNTAYSSLKPRVKAISRSP